MGPAERFRIGSFVLTEDEVGRRKAYLEIGPEDEALLRETHAVIVPHVDAIVERFYDYLLRHEPTRDMLSAPGLVERLKKIQKRYFLELTAGVYDAAYFENRLRVGLAHERVGLGPRWYLGAYGEYRRIVDDVLRAELGEGPRFVAVSRALDKIISLDMSLAIDAYVHSAAERLEEKAEALARANERLRALDAEKRRLTDMIVHDLQSPLAGITAVLDVLAAKREGFSDEERAAVRQALARAGDLQQLILNVLQISRAEEGKLELYWESVDIGEVAAAVAGAFGLVAEQSGRRLVVEPPARPVTWRTDRSLLSRILYNLVRNALRHTPEGTTVRLRVENGTGGALVVCDDGPGIPESVRGRLFEPFSSRAGRPARALEADSGLGLAFCKMAADALGLDFGLESEAGEGARFVLRPRAEGPRA